jgi:hypothetical protein
MTSRRARQGPRLNFTAQAGDRRWCTQLGPGRTHAHTAAAAQAWESGEHAGSACDALRSPLRHALQAHGTRRSTLGTNCRRQGGPAGQAQQAHGVRRGGHGGAHTHSAVACARTRLRGRTRQPGHAACTGRPSAFSFRWKSQAHVGTTSGPSKASYNTLNSTVPCHVSACD